MNHPKFSKRIHSIEVSAIKQMALESQKYDDVISFGWGVPSFSTNEIIRQSVVEAFKNKPDLDKYAPVPGLPSLRSKVADLWPKLYGFEIKPEQVLITAGAMEGVMCLIQSLFDRGDEVLLMDPGFSSHIEQAEITGVIPKFVALDESKGWAVTEKTLRAQISDKTKGLILINPNNPTGHIFSKEDIKIIAKVVKEYNLWLILDEPYTHLLYDQQKLFHPLQIPEIRQQTVVVHSFSKKYSMTGWRVGYVVGPADLILELMKVHDATVVSAPRISQIAAQAALTIPDDAFNDEVAIVENRRNLMCDWLDKMPDLFSYVRPTGAYYVLPKIEANNHWSDDMKLAKALLHDVQVVTTPGYAFGPTGKNHLRFCFSDTEESINQGMQRVLDWWNKQKKT